MKDHEADLEMSSSWCLNVEKNLELKRKGCCSYRAKVTREDLGVTEITQRKHLEEKKSKITPTVLTEFKRKNQ